MNVPSVQHGADQSKNGFDYAASASAAAIKKRRLERLRWPSGTLLLLLLLLLLRFSSLLFPPSFVSSRPAVLPRHSRFLFLILFFSFLFFSFFCVCVSRSFRIPPRRFISTFHWPNPIRPAGDKHVAGDGSFSSSSLWSFLVFFIYFPCSGSTTCRVRELQSPISITKKKSDMTKNDVFHDTKSTRRIQFGMRRSRKASLTAVKSRKLGKNPVPYSGGSRFPTTLLKIASNNT